MKTATTYTLPKPHQIAETLQTLFNREVSVAVSRTPPKKPGRQFAAEFCTPEGEPAVLCLIDAVLACSAGAALALLPAGVANESARRPQPDARILDNLAEVMNVISGMFAGGGRRVVLRRIHVSLDTLPPTSQPLRDSPPGRLDLEIEIAGYGGGALTALVM